MRRLISLSTVVFVLTEASIVWAETNPFPACAGLLLPTSPAVPLNTPAFYAEAPGWGGTTTTQLLRDGQTVAFSSGADSVVWPKDALVEGATYELSVIGASCHRSAATFTVGPWRPLPVDAGTLEALPQTFVQYARGTPYRYWSAERIVVFTASASLVPFLGTTLKWFVLDGARQASEPAERGWPLVVSAPCGDESWTSSPRPGHHVVSVGVAVVGGPAFQVPPVDVDLDCSNVPPLTPLDAAADAPADAGNGTLGGGGGCALITATGGAPCGAALVVALLLVRRRARKPARGA